MSQNTSKCKSGMYIWIYVCVNVIHVWHVLEYTVEVFVCFWSPGWAFNFGEHRGTLHGNLYMFRVLVVNYDKTISISGCSSLVKGLFRKKTRFLLIVCPKFPSFEETSNNAPVPRRKACGLMRFVIYAMLFVALPIQISRQLYCTIHLSEAITLHSFVFMYAHACQLIWYISKQWLSCQPWKFLEHRSHDICDAGELILSSGQEHLFVIGTFGWRRWLWFPSHRRVWVVSGSF